MCPWLYFRARPVSTSLEMQSSQWTTLICHLLTTDMFTTGHVSQRRHLGSFVPSCKSCSMKLNKRGYGWNWQTFGVLGEVCWCLGRSVLVSWEKCVGVRRRAAAETLEGGVVDNRAATTNRLKSIIKSVGNEFHYRFVVSRDYYATQ